MPEFTTIVWDHEPGQNVEHLAEHDVTPEEAEWVLSRHFEEREPSRSSDRWVVQGATRHGRYLVVVFEYLEDFGVVIPVTAFEP